MLVVSENARIAVVASAEAKPKVGSGKTRRSYGGVSAMKGGISFMTA